VIFQIQHYCPDPNCGNLVNFVVSQVGELVKREADPDDPVKFRPVAKVRSQQPVPASLEIIEGCGVSRCPHCGEPLLIIFRTTRQLLHHALHLNSNPRMDASHRLIANDSVVVIKTYPESREPTAHPTWPEKIRKPFVDLQKMLSEHRHPSFIISGCRSVLDVATRDLGGTKDKLVHRIDELANMNIVTGVLQKWSHKLRLDGNEAAHELGGTPEEAAQLVEFIRLFLHVTYELPATISVKAPPGTLSPAPGAP
jgi:hypothetical protein